jgi:hypothetical protein
MVLAVVAGACSDAMPTEPSPSILVNPGAMGVPASGQTGLTITVTANVSWTVTVDSPAVTIASGSTGSGNGTITCNVAANTGVARTIHLVVASTVTTGGTAVAGVTLSQVGATVH